MSKNVPVIPEGYPSLSPYLIIRDAPRAIEFYEAAFAGQVMLRVDNPDGTIMHAEVMIGGAVIMIGDDSSTPGSGPDNWPISLHLYVDDADAWIARALAAGATLVAPVTLNEADGEKRGGVRDPFGFTWWLATRVQDVARAEMQRRHDAKKLR